MAAEWFYQAKGQELGPVDSRELRRLAEAGIVRPDTLVRQGTSGRWVHAEPFDPYQKWLGIPPEDQPPNYYRLLGLRLHESDQDAISNAADRAMAFIRTLQSGVHSRYAEPILNEVAAARVCLLNPEKKQHYDEMLRALQSRKPGPDGMGSTARPPMPGPTALDELAFPDWRPPREGNARQEDIVLAEGVRGLFQRSTPAPSPSLGASRPPPLPQPSPVAESGAPRRAVSGEGSIRHGVPAAAVNEAAEKPERIWPVTWVAIIVGSGTMLVLLWALVFRGGSAPQQQAEKDQPLLVAARPAKGTSAPVVRQGADPWAEFSAEPAGGKGGQKLPVWTPETGIPPPPGYDQGGQKLRVWTPELGKSLGIPPPPDWEDKTAPAADPAADSKSRPATGGVKVLELADLAELVGPSVVQVNVTGPEGAFTGSGFVLDKQGTIVTNYHVIEDATAGTIIFSDKTSAPITGYLGAWPEKDIALLRVECPPDKLHPLRLAMAAPRQGERVAAFGSPLGLQQSVSEGIVSAVRKSRELRALGPIDVNALLIQTTTPISQGNSGGPLVDMKGLVVGVNTWSLRALGGENVNFAVAAVELPALLLAKNGSPSPLPANAPAAAGVRRILSRACDHLKAGEYDRAIADFTEAIRLDPKDAFAYDGRGDAYRGKRDYDRAIADFTEAIRLDPKDAFAYYGRGLAYQAKGQHAAAERDFAQAKKLGYQPAAPVPPPGYKVWSPADTRIPPPPGRRSAPIVEESQREVAQRRAVVSAWRRLRLGMSPAQVEKLLGQANDVHTFGVVGLMTWDYRYPDRISRYEGHVEFSQNGVSGWSEPREWAKD